MPSLYVYYNLYRDVTCLLQTVFYYKKSTYAENFGENDVLAVEPGGLLGGDEELRTVGVLSSVGHRQPSGAEMLQLEVLVCEFFSIDGSATGS